MPIDPLKLARRRAKSGSTKPTPRRLAGAVQRAPKAPILAAVLVKVIAMAGPMFALAKLLGH